MTEKVVLTKEQVEAIEEFQKTVHELGISLDELKVIFESGYEVKPEFKVGDWFVYIGKDGEVAEYIKKGFTGQVESVHYGFITDGYHKFNNSEIRHATPEEIAEEKERRWWSELGRNVNEYRVGDIVKGLGCITERWRLGPVKKIFEYENAVQIEDISDGKTIDLDKGSCKLICPAENRLDVKSK